MVKDFISKDTMAEGMFLEQFLDNLPYGVQIFDTTGLTAYMNKKQIDLLGIKDAEMAVGKFNVFTDPYSVANGSADFYMKVYKSKKPARRDFKADFGIEENTWDTIREVRYVHEYAFPVCDTNGNISKIVAVLNDYTVDAISKEILFESELRFRSIFENSVSGIVFTDAEGKLILANRSFQELTGLDQEGLKGMAFTELIHKEDRPEGTDLTSLYRCPKTEDCRFEKRYVRKNGDLVWGDTSIRVIRDEKDQPVNFVVTLTDITQKKQAEIELSKAHSFNQSIIETSPVGIVLVNKNGQVAFANKKAEILLGLSKENIKQRTYNDPVWKITAIDGGPFPDSALPFERVRTTKQGVNDIQHAIEWPNGKRICLSINALPELDSTGEFTGMVATLEDITERLAIEDQNLRKSTFLQAIISNAAEGLCVCHNCKDYPFVRFTVWNEKMTKITGYTMDEINELGWYQTLYEDPEIREKTIKRMESMRQGQDITGEEWLITTKDKSKRIVSIATSVIAVDGEEINVMALMNDITEKQKARAEVEGANKKLKELNDSKDRFFEILAHDLKGPLATSLSLSQNMLESLEKANEEANTRKFAGYIHDSLLRSFSLLEDLLGWAQAQTHRAEFNPTKTQLSGLIKQVVGSLEAMAKNKDIGIELGSGDDIMVLVDKNMMRTVLRNLINNAIKYSLKGGKVVVKITKLNKAVKFSVVDQGVGIDEERMKDMFRIDKNISTRGTDNEKGTGLGLLLCKELVDYHKGKIWAKSTPGKGTAFHVTIPVNL